MLYFPTEFNNNCTDDDFECTKFQGKCSHNGTDTFCKCEKDYKGPTCAGRVDFYCFKNKGVEGVYRICKRHKCAADDQIQRFQTQKY